MTACSTSASRWRGRAHILVCTLVLLMAALWSASARAALDTTAHTDDHSINTPTGWSSYTNLTPQALSEQLADSNVRLVGLEVSAVTSSGEPRFLVRLVANQGAYHVPQWWWAYDQTAGQVAAMVDANQGRLIEIDRYDRGGGQIRYAVVMVANSGATQRGWSYVLGVTRAQLRAHMRGTSLRPIDLDGWGTGDARRYNAVFVHNTGSDYRLFDWDTDLTPEQIVTRTTGFQGRVVKLGRVPGGRYLFVQVRNTNADRSAWWHKYGFSSLDELNNHALQMGARPVDIVSYSTASGRRYDAALIDNANATERRLRNAFAPFIDANQNPLGIFSAYIKQVDGPVLANFNGDRPAETASAIKVLHLLHAMRAVQAGTDSLGSIFTFYNYPDDGSGHVGKDRCPRPEHENSAYDMYSTLEWGLDRMMQVSDNRTTRGVVLRYGGFGPLNNTAAAIGMVNTRVRHNVGCGYWDPVNQRLDPDALRNETTAADLARLYERVRNSTALNSTNRARAEFLESTRLTGGAGLAVREVVEQEAAAQGKSAVAVTFFNLIRQWGKGGSYGTCLGDPADMTQCGQGVHIGSFGGLLSLPLGAGPVAGFHHYSYSLLFSDVPFDDKTQAGQALAEDQNKAMWNDVNAELMRPAIRAALLAW
jgi:beta-lactamase class A